MIGYDSIMGHVNIHEDPSTGHMLQTLQFFDNFNYDNHYTFIKLWNYKIMELKDTDENVVTFKNRSDNDDQSTFTCWNGQTH